MFKNDFFTSLYSGSLKGIYERDVSFSLVVFFNFKIGGPLSFFLSEEPPRLLLELLLALDLSPWPYYLLFDC